MTAARVYTIAAAALDVPPRWLMCKRPAYSLPVARARHLAWWLAYSNPGVRYVDVGDLFGLPWHTVRYGINRTDEGRMWDPTFHAITDAARDFMRADLRREGRAA